MDKKSCELSELDTTKGAEDGFELVLTHPKTGAELPGRIRVRGADSEAYRDKQREFQRVRVARLNKMRKFAVSPEEIEAEAVELLVAVTEGWSGISLNGAEYPFSGDNARALYLKYGWIREQVDQAVQDRSNFLPRSASA